jgi:hypothetical protein
MAAASFVGVAAAGALDTAAANSQNGVAGWSCTLTTANPSDLLLGWSGINANSTSTPAAPSTELHDFGSSTFRVGDQRLPGHDRRGREGPRRDVGAYVGGNEQPHPVRRIQGGLAAAVRAVTAVATLVEAPPIS